MPSSVNNFGAICYGLGLTGFFAFSCQVALRARGNWRQRVLLAALVITTIWELAGLAVAWQAWPVSSIVYDFADCVRYGGWLLLITLLLARPGDDAGTFWRNGRLITAIGITLVLAATTLLERLGAGESTAGPMTGPFALWVAACVYGVVVCEQLFRGTAKARRWAIKPLCLALGASFAFDLFVFADATMLRTVDGDLWSIRGLVHALTIPLVMVATVRNRDWTIDVAVSRVVVFRSTALLLSGVYLLAVAGAGYYVRFLGGSWGKAIQTIFFFIAGMLLLAFFSSGTIQSRLRVFISKHFFSYRYDYRAEWLRFTNLLANSSEDLGVSERSIKALADLVESPGGALWLKTESGSYSLIRRWNLSHPALAADSGGSLPEFLARTGWIIDLVERHLDPERYPNLVLPRWLGEIPSAWLIIPLPSTEGLLGFVLLVKPRTPLDLNWEVLDLLKTAARQAASFLGHVQATEALLEAKQFDAFNRMSAFVVHDLKNLISQLLLMLRNSERHTSNPEFQRDMQSTIRHVVDRMNRLLLQLRSGTTPVENSKYVDVCQIIHRVETALATSTHHFAFNVQPGLRALGHEDRLERVIGHLVQNAIDAMPTGGEVKICAYTEGDRTIIDVLDTGQGMTPGFVRDRLFKPFDSTKSTGMGIGAYESQQYVSGIGGCIDVDSAPGVGTRMRIILPASPHEHEELGSRREAA